MLLETRPKAIAKADLHERLWPSTFVADATLASLVAELRDALGERGRETRFIRTVHGFGYAFSGEARSEADHKTPRSWPETNSLKALQQKLAALSMIQWRLIQAVERLDGHALHHIWALCEAFAITPSEFHHRLRSLQLDHLVVHSRGKRSPLSGGQGCHWEPDTDGLTATKELVKTSFGGGSKADDSVRRGPN